MIVVFTHILSFVCVHLDPCCFLSCRACVFQCYYHCSIVGWLLLMLFALFCFDFFDEIFFICFVLFCVEKKINKLHGSLFWHDNVVTHQMEKCLNIYYFHSYIYKHTYIGSFFSFFISNIFYFTFSLHFTFFFHSIQQPNTKKLLRYHSDNLYF